MSNHPLTEKLKRTLGEGGRLDAYAVEAHLPTQIHNRQLDRFGVRGTDIPLKQQDHAQKGRSMRLQSRSRCAVHTFELLLKAVVEQLVSVQPEESEQRTYTCQSLDEDFLLRR
jgi:hypothetical protein